MPTLALRLRSRSIMVACSCARLFIFFTLTGEAVIPRMCGLAPCSSFDNPFSTRLVCRIYVCKFWDRTASLHPRSNPIQNACKRMQMGTSHRSCILVLIASTDKQQILGTTYLGHWEDYQADAYHSNEKFINDAERAFLQPVLLRMAAANSGA